MMLHDAYVSIGFLPTMLLINTAFVVWHNPRPLVYFSYWLFTNDGTSQNWLHVPIIGFFTNNGASQHILSELIIGVPKPPLCLNHWLVIIRCFTKYLGGYTMNLKDSEIHWILS